jgi:polar amino acid transport system substrate-binding protein/glutamate/aspartate transport system substrate-binding protein
MTRFLVALAAAALALPAAGQAPGSTLAKVRDARQIVLGYREAQAPFSFAGDDRQPAGYVVDLCQRVVASLRRELKLDSLAVRWVPVTAESRFAAVTGGQVDLECGTTTATLGRMREVDFSALTFIDGGGVLSRADAPVVRLADLAGRRVAVQAGTTAERNLPLALKERQVSAQVVTAKTQAEAVAMVEGGAVDAFATDRLVLLGAAARAKDPRKLALSEEDFSFEPYALMLRRNDGDFRLAVNRALAELYRSPGIVEIYDRWFGAFGKPGVLLASMYYLNALPE